MACLQRPFPLRLPRQLTQRQLERLTHDIPESVSKQCNGRSQQACDSGALGQGGGTPGGEALQNLSLTTHALASLPSKRSVCGPNAAVPQTRKAKHIGIAPRIFLHSNGRDALNVRTSRYMAPARERRGAARRLLHTTPCATHG